MVNASMNAEFEVTASCERNGLDLNGVKTVVDSKVNFVPTLNIF